MAWPFRSDNMTEYVITTPEDGFPREMQLPWPPALQQLLDASPSAQPLAFVVCAAACLELVRLSGVMPPAPACAAHSLASFTAFYPRYLREHSRISTKRCHYAGTAALLLLLLRSPALLLAIAAAAALGLAAYPWTRWMRHGALEAAAVLAAYAACSAHLGAATAAAPLLVGYGAAWVGHFFFERNRPDTFIYPTFSLFGDFRMFGEMLIGKQPL